MKTCATCKLPLKTSAFGNDVNKHDGLKNSCKVCRNETNRLSRAANPEQHRKTNLAYARSEAGKLKQWAASLSRKYWPHLIPEESVVEYHRILSGQGGTCALCCATETSIGTRLHVDHDKASGQIRGILCDFHNRVVVQDKTKDDVIKLFNYFKKFYNMDDES